MPSDIDYDYKENPEMVHLDHNTIAVLYRKTTASTLTPKVYFMDYSGNLKNSGQLYTPFGTLPSTDLRSQRILKLDSTTLYCIIGYDYNSSKHLKGVQINKDGNYNYNLNI